MSTYILTLSRSLAFIVVASSYADTQVAAKPAAAAKPVATAGTSITVYSSADPGGFDPQRYIQAQRGGYDANDVPGYAIVKVVRKVAIPAGIGTVAFTDVAAFIDPTTVSFTDLEDAATAVLEQNFQFDLVSPAKLMERYIGRTITLSVPMGDSVSNVEGELLSANQGQLVLSTIDGIRIVPSNGAQVQLGDLPGGLLTKPTLLWKLSGGTGGDHLVRTTYKTSGMTWRADYNIVLDGADKSASLTGWVTLMNLSGASYPGAQLKLVAGKVQTIQPNSRGAVGSGGGARPRMLEMVADGFEEKEFFEYHLYSLPRATDVMENSTQQITLFPPVDAFKVKKELIFDWTAGYGVASAPIVDRDFTIGDTRKPAIMVSFENKKDNALGMPLPAGKIRVFKEDSSDGTLEFIGEDLIDHTPRNETVKIKLGEAFDVVGERVRTDFTIDSAGKRMTETFRIEIRNQKSSAQTVRIIERLYRWTNWQISAKSDNFTKLDSNTIAFDFDVPPEGRRAVTYTVVYTW